MKFRHALVVGSQCDELANQRLSFLPDRARRLFELLTDSGRGNCAPAPDSVLLEDPTLAELEEAVETAVKRAVSARATLVFAFIGHAETDISRTSRPLFLLPRDGSAAAPKSKTAYEIGHRLGEMDLGGLDGLILILDTCHAGAGVRDVIKSGLDLKDQVRLELLAGTYLREARNGCFSQSLIDLMENGQADLSTDYLEIRHAANAAADTCRAVQDPPVYIGSGIGQNASDPGLWVTRNVASPGHWPLSGTAEGAQAVALTQSFQATHDLERITHALGRQRLVVVQGGPGSGKSALVSALARPELVPDLPRRYLSAVAFTALTPTLPALAGSIARQLADTAGFPEAATAYGSGFTPEELDRLPALERLVFGPLRQLKVPLGRKLRLAIDGIDQLEPAVRGDLLRTVTEASRDPRLERVGLLLNTRGDGTENLGVVPIVLARPGEDEIAEYLTSLDLPVTLAADLAAHASSWLQLRLLTDVATALGKESVGRVTGLAGLYRQLLTSLAGENTGETRVVLTVLAAAGSGPVLPLRIAAEACSRMGGPADEARFRDIIAALGDIGARADPGTPSELVGLFHETLVQQVRHEDDWTTAIHEAHEAILDVLESMNDPAWDTYRHQRAPEHLWELGRYGEAIEMVVSGLGHRAVDNRELLQSWADRAEDVLSADGLDWMKLQQALAHWTGAAGDTAGAIALFDDLLQDQIRVLGPDAPATLTIRNNLAHWTGQAGDTAGAITLGRELIQDLIRVLGPDDPATLAARSNLAYCTGRAGDTAGAVALFGDLLQDLIRVLGPDAPATLAARNNLASLTGEAGDTAGAIALFGDLLQDLIRVLGPDNPATLAARNNLAHRTGQAGDTAGAIALFGGLLQDQIRILGPDAPNTLATRNNLATWTGRAGDTAGAIALFGDLLQDQIRILGPDAPNTLATRNNLASLTGQAGDTAGAIALFDDLLQDQIRILGPDAPATLTTRNNLAALTGQAGDTAGAIALFADLLQNRIRILGPDAPDTLAARNNLATWTGEAGDTAGAIALFADLLQDQIRILGPDAPDTLTTRNNLATWTGAAGDTAGAIALFRELLQDRIRILGPDAPDTLTTRNNLATWTGQAGDTAGAITLFGDLLEDRIRILGPDAPDTLTTRNNLASSIGEAGDTAGAIVLFRELLQDLIRVLGPDAPATLAARSNLASWAGEGGDTAGAIALFDDLLQDRIRVLGPDAPATLTTRNNLATLTARAGDTVGAIALFRELLQDQIRILGPDAPDTLTTRSNLASLTGQAGDTAGAIALFRELLQDQIRILGLDAPDTLTTRSWLNRLES
jgi:hypothetical protein